MDKIHNDTEKQSDNPFAMRRLIALMEATGICGTVYEHLNLNVTIDAHCKPQLKIK